MALYDSTTQDINSEVSAVYDNDGTADHQFSAVYDNDGTADHLLYSAELVILNGSEINYGLTFSKSRDTHPTTSNLTASGMEFSTAAINTTMSLAWTTDPIDITGLARIRAMIDPNWVRLNGPAMGGNAEAQMFLQLISSKTQDAGDNTNIASVGGQYAYQSAAGSGTIVNSDPRSYTLDVSGITGSYCVRLRSYYYCIGNWNENPAAYGTIKYIIAE